MPDRRLHPADVLPYCLRWSATTEPCPAHWLPSLQLAVVAHRRHRRDDELPVADGFALEAVGLDVVDTSTFNGGEY